MMTILSLLPGDESEDENKGMSEEEIKAKLQEEFAATMAENERMLKEMEQKWEEKLAEAEKENKDKVCCGNIYL